MDNQWELTTWELAAKRTRKEETKKRRVLRKVRMLSEKYEQHKKTLEERDNCEVCRGTKGGVKGNEQIVDGRVMCDYCHAEYMKERKE